MPLYEYECQSCHRRIEKIQKFSDAPLTVCPHCGGVLQKTITAPAVQFKGGGWYADGYGSSGGSKKSDSSKTETPSSKSSDSTSKSESSSTPAPAAAPAAPAPSTSSSDKK